MSFNAGDRVKLTEVGAKIPLFGAHGMGVGSLGTVVREHEGYGDAACRYVAWVDFESVSDQFTFPMTAEEIELTGENVSLNEVVGSTYNTAVDEHTADPDQDYYAEDAEFGSAEFYEDDEELEDVEAAFEEGEQGTTADHVKRYVSAPMVSIDLDFDERELLDFMSLAHREGVSFQQLMERATYRFILAGLKQQISDLEVALYDAREGQLEAEASLLEEKNKVTQLEELTATPAPSEDTWERRTLSKMFFGVRDADWDDIVDAAQRAANTQNAVRKLSERGVSS